MRVRYTGLAAIAVLWTFIPIALWQSHLSLTGSAPLNELSQERGADLWFSGGLALAALLLVPFHGYLTERYTLSAWFSGLMLAGIVAQFAAAVVPMGEDLRSSVHQIAAAVFGAVIPLILWRFAMEQHAGRWRDLCFALVAVDVVACALGIALAATDHPALGQVVAMIGFHLWVVAVTVKPRGDAEDIPALGLETGLPE